jgi:hypothetical protein
VPSRHILHQSRKKERNTTEEVASASNDVKRSPEQYVAKWGKEFNVPAKREDFTFFRSLETFR